MSERSKTARLAALCAHLEPAGNPYYLHAGRPWNGEPYPGWYVPLADKPPRWLGCDAIAAEMTLRTELAAAAAAQLPEAA